jgi:transposase
MINELDRYYIKIRTILEIDPKTIYEGLTTAVGPNTPSYRTVLRWTMRFREGREDVNDDPRSDRPVSELTNESIELVRQVINDGPHSTYDDIIAVTFLSHGTIERIFHDHVKMRKVTSRRMPRQLNDEQKQKQVRVCRENWAKFCSVSWGLCDIITGDETWIYHRQIGHKSTNKSWVGEGESPTTMVRRTKFEPKNLFSVFFKRTPPPFRGFSRTAGQKFMKIS